MALSFCVHIDTSHASCRGLEPRTYFLVLLCIDKTAVIKLILPWFHNICPFSWEVLFLNFLSIEEMQCSSGVLQVYSTSVAMLLTAVASVFLFGFHLSIAFFLGSTVVSVSVYLHSVEKLQPQK